MENDLTREELGKIINYLLTLLDEPTRQALMRPYECPIHTLYDPLCRLCNGIIMVKIDAQN